jgi:predicted AlkP superfamily phosphohydrolase/phosphomutase
VGPHLELYVTPTNIDPLAPALPISVPASFAADLAAATGRFYTQGMPEDTKGLAAGVLTVDEFLEQARLSAAEVRRQYRHLLRRFQAGFLFYYVGHVDQVSHVMWRTMDPEHPAYDRGRDERYRHVIEDLYVDLDGMVGETLEARPEDTLVVMSDHGFASWRRSFHLNSWLEQNGYLARRRGSDRRGTLLEDVDWSRTRAYGLGLNALYINVKGREQQGVVAGEARAALAKEIKSRLLGVVDPKTEQRAITKVYERDALWPRAQRLERAPDLIVGYAKGTRVSNQSAIGEIPSEVFADNLDAWSGDHCMDDEAVPGVLLSSRPLRGRASMLRELAASLLAEYGIDWN